MKKNVLYLVVAAIAFFLTSCGGKPENTIKNLTAAYNGESTASAKYAKFAEKAREDSLFAIAVMFESTSRAEAIHADNHKKVLEKLGAVVEAPVIETFEVKTTVENLADASKGESYEISTMYPEFIVAAETEGAKDAVKSFTWALDTEKKHNEFYQKAIGELTAGNKDTQLPKKWFVCPICGNTYDDATVKASCDFCSTAQDKYEVFE